MAAAADAMSEESKGVHMGEPLSGSRAADRERRRELSQERQPHGPIFEENQEEDLREANEMEAEEGQGLDQTQTYPEQHQSKMNNEGAESIDKDKFLEIVSSAFDKVISSLHPRVGGSLNQIRSMYDHYMEQVEYAHQQELQQNAIQIQDLQSCVTELQVVHQQLEMQLGQNQ